ncbi:hypothetical protein C4K14_1903 [Pseudomonas chlororaphis subsp. aureofaciens]|nr:hypothetical protein [Pseudomonas chlororaphis]AZD84737.1 hypothetical protein C4K14_1903 [Pseudomonas chlororaphis subsp. aureofaciens]
MQKNDMQDDEPTLTDNAITLTCSAAALVALIAVAGLVPDLLLSLVR